MASLSEDSDLSKSLHRIYIIGGAQLYKASLESPEIADRILLTQITRGSEKWSCDTFFPELDNQAWKQATEQEHHDWLQGVDFSTSEVTEGDVAWKYQMWTRRPSQAQQRASAVKYRDHSFYLSINACDPSMLGDMARVRLHDARYL
jgi:hypothetical protein